MKSRMSSSYMTSAVSKVETKMIVIPVVFILLRVWSLLFVIITVEAGQSLSCPVVTFFLYVGVSTCLSLQNQVFFQEFSDGAKRA